MFPPHGLLAGEPAPSAQVLLDWCAEQDVEVSPALSIEERHGGWGLVAKEPIELGTVREWPSLKAVAATWATHVKLTLSV